MAENRDNINLEEQLREDRRLAATHRRRKRMKWLIPLSCFLMATVAVLVVMIRSFRENRAEPTETEPPAEASAVLAFVGDISMDEAAVNAFRTPDGYDFSACFRRVMPQLLAADLTLGNLEGNISDTPSDHTYPPALLDTLYASGFDVLQTANSYSIQNGITGLIQTKQAIESAGMDALGTYGNEEEWEESGGVLVREVNGIRFAFIGFTKGVNSLRLPDGAGSCVNLLYTDYDTNFSVIARSDILAVLERARALEPDVIVALLHWGSEYSEEITSSQKEIASLLFSNGVSLIVGSHSHYVGPMESGRGSIFGSASTFIAYGLGDFLSAADTTAARNGCILSVRFDKKGDDIRLTTVNYTPTFSAAPDEDLGTTSYEVVDSLDAISFYESGYYDRVPSALYEKLKTYVERMKEQTGAGELQIKKQ